MEDGGSVKGLPWQGQDGGKWRGLQQCERLYYCKSRIG